MNEAAEKEKLNVIAQNSIYGQGVGRTTTLYCGKIFLRHMITPGSVLEMGPADGVMTELLYTRFQADYTVVDAGEAFIAKIKEKFPGIHSVVTLFEAYEPQRFFDNIILGHVLEHVANPVALLHACKQWLTARGRIFAAVPNQNSIHRQAAVKMGLLARTDELNEKDRRHGHRRVFDLEALQTCFSQAELEIYEKGGYWLKPLADRQIEKTWTPAMITAFLELGESYPEIAGEIYCIAGKKGRK